MALVLASASQPWIQAQATDGSNFFFASGVESVPSLLPLLLLSGLCVVLVAYIKKTWTVSLLVMAALATALAIYLCLPVAMGSDLSPISRIVAKATGIQDWQSQQETVIAEVTNTTQAIGALFGLVLKLVFEIGTAATFFNKRSDKIPSKRNATPAQAKDLWGETSK